MIKWIRTSVADFKSGKSPRLGILIILGITLFILLLPWLFTNISMGLSFGEINPIGDTFGGIVGPFIALGAAILTFLAFWVQYQANQMQKEQIQKQNQDQIFYRLSDTLEKRIVNSSFNLENGEVKSYQLLEEIVSEFKKVFKQGSSNFSRNFICNNFDKLSNEHLFRLMALKYMNVAEELQFDKRKNEFLAEMTLGKFQDRWEYIKDYVGSTNHENSKQKELLEDIALVSFYKIEFSERVFLYNTIYEQVEKKYGSFLDGYLRGWEFICQFTFNAIDRLNYVQYLKSQLSKFEMVIIFYYIASGYSDPEFKAFVKDYGFLNNLYYYNEYLIDWPSIEELDTELKNIFTKF